MTLPHGHSTHEDEPDWSTLTVTDRFQASVGGLHKGKVSRGRGRVLGPLRRRLIATDALVVAAAIALGLLISSRATTWNIDPTLAIYGTPVGIAALWLALLGLKGSYDERIVGIGTEEIRRIISATLYTFAVVAGLSYLIRADISRAYAFVSLPVGLVLLVMGRFVWRGWLYRQRGQGELQYETLVVGSGAAAAELCERLNEDGFAGYRVAGHYDDPDTTQTGEDWVKGLTEAIDRLEVHAVALSPADTLTSTHVRQLAWELEGRSVDLLIAPTIFDISGPRLSVRPAAGLPLLHLDEATLTLPKRFAKRSLDLILGSLLLVILSPVIVAVAVSVRLSSRGPIVFRQTRVGRAGETFTMLKFRTMVVGSDAQRAELRRKRKIDDPMFKLRDDPRVTRVGRFLRRWSLDELPQLLNVIGGSMSLVGPRPHPLDDVSRYELAAYRRLALKPGLTGLWQVEGRSDVGWAEALQLDLYYVETWSLSGDVVLLARTARAVLQGRGAH